MAIIRWTVNDIALMLYKAVKNKYDCPIIITGGTSSGKSTLSYQISKALRRLGFHKFNPEEDLIYDPQEASEEIDKRFYSTIIIDEAVNVMFNRDWYNELQKKIIKALNMNRHHYNIVFFNLPSGKDVDKKLLSVARIWVHVVERGLAIIKMKNQGHHSRDDWDIAINEKIERKFIEKKRKINYTKLTTYRGHLKFSKLTEREEKIYEEIKTRKKKELKNKNSIGREEIVNPHDKILSLLLDGKVKNKREFELVCESNNLLPRLVNNNLRQKLRDIGSDKNPKDFFIENFKKRVEQKRKKQFKKMSGGVSLEIAKMLN